MGEGARAEEGSRAADVAAPADDGSGSVVTGPFLARNCPHLPELWKHRLRGRDWCGVSWYAGCPHIGKTTLALHHAIGASCELQLPLLVLDSRRASQLAHVPHVPSIGAAIVAVWKDRRTIAYKPRSIDEVDRLCRAVAAGRDALLLVDESHFWLSSRSGSSSELIGLMRANQHERTHLFLTTQHFSGDIPQAALSCAPDFYVFRCTSWRARKVLRDEFDIDPESIRCLPKWHYLQHASGF